MGGSGGMPEMMINGCLSTSAMDLTAEVSAVFAWGNPHHMCSIVEVGQHTGWVVNKGSTFIELPLVGGTVAGDGTPTKIDNAPASTVDQSGQVAIHVYSIPGVYPYYCENFPQEMKGVVYVVQSGGGGTGGAGGGGTGGAGGN